MVRKTADVVVIGGGVMGTSIAFHLAKQKAGQIILFEKNTIGSGPTGRSGALLRRHYSLEVYARMATRSLEIYRNFKELTGVSADISWCGMITLVGPEDIEPLSKTVAMLKRIGADAEALDPGDLRRLAPAMDTEGVAGAGYDPTTGYADPAAVTYGYANRARELGVEILQRTTVTDIAMDGERVTGVVTVHGLIETRNVVNAAGVWAARIAKLARTELPIAPCRAQVASFRVPFDFPEPRLIVGDNINRCYFRPKGRDLLLVGARSQPGALEVVDPERNDECVDPENVVKAGEVLRSRFPAMVHGELTGGYASMYDMTPDGHFILEAAPDRSGLFTAAGFSGHGFKHSPVIGKMMADLVCQGTTEEIELDVFSSRRFSDGRPPLRGIYNGFAF